jgi:hypothetical protein
LPTPSIFFIPLLDLLVFPSPLSPLDPIYLLFSHTPNLGNLCQFQGPGTNPNGSTKIQFSLFALYLCSCSRLDINVRITVAGRTELRNVFTCLNVEIVGSNPARSTNVRSVLCCACVVLCSARNPTDCLLQKKHF